MRILVTGSNGFVGGKIAAALLARGDVVVGLGRASAPASPVSQYLCHDLAQPLIWAEPVDAVIHCAALSASWASPHAYQQANVAGTRHVLEYGVRTAFPYLIYISSSSIFYQAADQFNLTEASPIPADEEQINEYSRTKRQGELLVQGYAGPWAVLRPRAVFGPGDTVIFPRILRAAAAGRLPLLARADGHSAIGDLIYIDTLVAYVLGALDRRFQGELNLTNNQPVAIHEFLRRLLQQLGYPAPRWRVSVAWALRVARLAEWVSAGLLGYREPPLTRFGVAVFAYSKTFDVRKCLAELGPPAVTVEEGLARFVAWWQQQPPPAA
ncbi:MAG: NAD-dependent epimerase/dehydratase family protein [Janthinobacterium lividum]